ncbi:glycoside hydrolase [Asanoa sp. WMMD1127]|uniref:glycoside hydrolase n=1 Tax=Asanoa sp. WMMD1127 TaxID=3016107 RepID=UPI0024169CF4|nr:glycoside hydrolase [Asanoa sp. WMMD1127]MDG4825737.1 glycoside hydrolase [Asanoa sp. WMMD1127]
MRRRRGGWTIGLAVVVGAAGTLLAPTGGAAHPPARPTAVVDWHDERQTIDGFGGSFAFHKAGGIQRLGEPLTSQLLDMVFDDRTGIGLDIVRVMVGDGGVGVWGDQLYDGPTETIQPQPGVFVWDQPDWPAKKASFDSHQIWLMREARERGVTTFMASVWSPPAWMKQNNSVVSSGPDGPPNKIRPDMFQAFADYLAEYVLGYEREFGIRITHVSPTNEPEVTTGYSSSQWTAEELRTLVRDHLGPTFERRGVRAKIVLGEGVAFDERFALPAITDPAADRYVDVVAAHGYAGLVDEATRAAPDAFANARARGKTIWQTEYMNQGAPRDRLFVNNTISDGLRYAKLIANLFDETRLNAYFWWWPVANNGADGSDLIRLVNTGTPQSGNPTENGQYRIFKRYYTIGQYSRFVDQGSVMVGATKHPAPGLTLTAYKRGRDFAIVVVNDNPADVTIDVDLGRHEAVVPYRTSASENMRKLPAVHTRGRSFTTTLRGQSVTTFVPARAAQPAFPDRKDVFSTYLAEENDGHSPGLRVRRTDERGPIITGVRDGSFIRWANVNFADGSAAGFADQKGELRLHATVAPRAGGVIEARVDGPRGKVVGQVTVPPGDGWVTATTWIDTSPGAANGFHDLYLVFRGGRGQLFDVDTVAFSD